MQKQNVVLNDQNKSVTIKNDPENPFIKIWKKSSRFPVPAEEKICNSIIEITIFKGQTNEKINLEYSNSEGFKKLHEIPILDDLNINAIQIELRDTSCSDVEFGFEVQIGKELIDISNPIKEFEHHITFPLNAKILFSAPFGQGKTTFLNYFFEQKEKNYDVFKVFPVNYAVASNEDIFRYIKTDILFQLLSKDVEFDKKEISQITTTQEFLYLHPKKTISNFIRKIMSLDKRTATIKLVVEALASIVNQISDYHEEQQVDDQRKTNEYIREVYEIEGSIFEDNFYTQLIRQQLEKIKTNNHKEMVLIIEDLDRMDPDHIFRILNVISAHYDTYRIHENDEHNKFGFDKIILVCDEENIKNIFHHKYGEKTDFNGYFNKYFSSRPFYFKNHPAINLFLKELYFDDSRELKKSAFAKAHSVILEALVVTDLVNLRELKRFIQNDFDKYKFNHYYKEGLFYKSLAFLDEMLGNKLISLLQQLQNLNFDTGRRFDYYSKCLIAGIVDRRATEFEYRRKTFTIKLSSDFQERFPIIQDITIKNSNEDYIEFTHEDFYDLLIKAYYELKNPENR